MQGSAGLPGLAWIVMCWQAVMLLIAATVWLLTRSARTAKTTTHDEPPPTTHTPPIIAQDAPGLRTIATFERYDLSQDLDAEELDSYDIFDDLIERLQYIGAEDLDVEESYADDYTGEHRATFVYREEAYCVMLDALAEEPWTLHLDSYHLDADPCFNAPSDSFTTRELLMELARYLRQAEVTDVRWHARQNLWTGNVDAWANTPL